MGGVEGASGLGGLGSLGSATSSNKILSSPESGVDGASAGAGAAASASAQSYNSSGSSVPSMGERQHELQHERQRQRNQQPLTDGIPAFRPNTNAQLQSFSADLASFSRWISDMKPEQQKAVADVFLSATSPSVISYIHERSASRPAAGSDGFGFSSPLSEFAVPAPERPISPLVMLNGDSISQASARMSANAPLFSSSARTPAPSSAAAAAAAPVASVPVVSPVLGSPVLGMISDPVARPRSAGPLSYITGDAPVGARSAAYVGGRSALQAPGSSSIGAYSGNPALSAQPLFRVFSSDLDMSSYQHKTRDFFSDDSQSTMHMPSLADQLEMSKTQFQPDGAQAAAAQQFGLTSASGFAGQNALKLNQSLSTMTRKPQQPQQQQVLHAPRAQHAQHAQHAQRTQHALHAHSANPSVESATMTSASPVLQAGATAAGQRGRARSAMRASAASSPSPKHSQASRNMSGHVSGTISPPSVVKSASPEDIASRKLLVDIPLWLKTLRLHKYTDNLKDLKWEEMIKLDDQQLADLGVSTLGARNKLLKSFAYVKENLHD